MLRYLKAAFWAGPVLPGLGKVPLNALLVVGAVILGFVEPAIWLAALGLETAFLFLLSTSGRFRRVVDAVERYEQGGVSDAQRMALINALPPPVRQRMFRLDEKCARVLELQTKLQEEDFSLASNRQALRRLGWLYLKLLTARHYLASQESQATLASLNEAIGQLERELADMGLLPSLRDSKASTLEILRKRLHTLERREQTLAEIDADLMRIEAQVDLALENAPLRGSVHAVSANIDLASDLLDADLFGASAATVTRLDSRYAQGSIDVKAPPPVEGTDEQARMERGERHGG